MKDRKTILIVSVFIILIISAVVGGVLLGNKLSKKDQYIFQKKEIIDCGTANAISEEDKAKSVYDCIFSSLKTCTPTKGTIIGVIEGNTMENGIIISNDKAVMSQNFVISGFEGDNCLYSIDIAAEQDNQKIGTGMNCKLPKEILVSYIKGEEVIFDYCEYSEIHGSQYTLKELYGGKNE